MVWVVIAAGVAFIALGLVFAGRFGTDPGISSSPLIGSPAPTSPIALMESEGEVTMTELLGDIVVVNFWASWCFGCQQEHESLLRAAENYASFDTTFVAINYQDSPARADAFLDELGRSSVTIYAIDAGSATAFDWGVLGLPETFFVDRDGIVVGKVSGPVTYGLLSQTIERIIIGETIGDITTGEVENR
jgi:cytochrome c biogenesis protein CcmG/thiol:disulfide interchange protein DsbE